MVELAAYVTGLIDGSYAATTFAGIDPPTMEGQEYDAVLRAAIAKRYPNATASEIANAFEIASGEAATITPLDGGAS